MTASSLPFPFVRCAVVVIHNHISQRGGRMDRPLMELMPQDVDEEWTVEEMEEAEAEVQSFLDQYYGQTAVVRGDV